MQKLKVDILAFAAHPDDIELACSGTILKQIKQGKKVAIVDLTQGELGTRGTPESREQEAAAASKMMGISARENLAMQDGFFSHNMQNTNKVIEMVRLYQPDIVLANAVEDRHPDHGRASKLVSEACFLSGLRKVETGYKGEWQEPWRPRMVLHYIQDRYIQPDVVMDVTEEFEMKMEVIKCFKTQFFDPNSKEPKTPISGQDFLSFIEARSREMGRAGGFEHGEGFTMEKRPGIQSFEGLF